MADTDRPRDPAEPRTGEWPSRPVLGVDQVGDDALVSEWEVGRADLAGHASEFVELSECRLLGGTLAGSSWYRPTWRDLVWHDLDAANSVVDEGALTRLSIERCRLTGAVWSGSTLSDVTISDSVLDLSALRDTTLTRVQFLRCRLSGADLTMARLTDVLFEDCDLSGVQFHQVRVQARCRLQGCELAGAQGLAALRGAVVRPTDLAALTVQLAQELGIAVDW